MTEKPGKTTGEGAADADGDSLPVPTDHAAAAPSRDFGELRELANFDLNLLVVFHAVMRTRHVGRAGRALGLSQPAVSHALKRLREALADPLFVKAPQGILTTPKADALAPAVARLLASLQYDVLRQESFDPALLQRNFVIRASGIIEVGLMPRLIAKLAVIAPRVQVAVRDVTPEFPRDDLANGRADLAIAGFFASVPGGFQRQVLLTDEFATATRAGHPRIGPGMPMTLDAYCNERHLLIAPGGALGGQVDRELEKLHRKRYIAAGVADFLAAGYVLMATDCILTGPASLINYFRRTLDIATYPPPLALPPIIVSQVWHERLADDPAHVWFRQLVQEIMMTPPPAVPISPANSR